MSTPPKDTPTPPHITGHSQIAVNKKWIAIIAAILTVFTIAVGTMYMVVATSRPATTNTGGY